jgi:SAM-dependent methyltransferase
MSPVRASTQPSVSSSGSTRAMRWLFHQVTDKDYVWTSTSGQRGPEGDLASVRQYLDRFPSSLLDVTGKTALDVGCGSGQLCFERARRGARRVVGADLFPASARANLEAQSREVAGRVEIVETDGTLRELAGDRFDFVFSKDSFEHFAEPEAIVKRMVAVVQPDGRLVIGFGPLWKGPRGGHIDFMTKVPWAHLLFPEDVILAERRRFRPEETARRFEEVRGGLNRMTLERFESIMATAGVERRYFATNVSENPVVRAMKVAATIRPLREYFTANVYSIWQMPSRGISTA